MMYRHDYVLMIAWGVTCLFALLALVFVGARAAGWDLLGSVAGSAVLGSMAGALAGVLGSSDPDGFPGLAIPGAIVGLWALRLLAFDTALLALLFLLQAARAPATRQAPLTSHVLDVG